MVSLNSKGKCRPQLTTIVISCCDLDPCPEAKRQLSSWLHLDIFNRSPKEPAVKLLEPITCLKKGDQGLRVITQKKVVRLGVVFQCLKVSHFMTDESVPGMHERFLRLVYGYSSIRAQVRPSLQFFAIFLTILDHLSGGIL